MTKVILDGVILAESDKTQIVEGNHYFPPESVKKDYFKHSDSEYTCPWKGLADALPPLDDEPCQISQAETSQAMHILQCRDKGKDDR
ncbi:hypothetical protein D9757_008488 [Collybiopsis confluens]|uniref:DUF427 domain-containing protein n=1 Tax=Collybiopsis confluens TaxID=2823264 RepID=A0A8H5HFG4_9AGAR|nr:hypothetical protein D9757_008488 [Collybiopsis confluens]